MERREGPAPIGIVRKVLLALGVLLFAIMSILIFTVDPSRDNDFWFLGFIYIIWTPIIVGLGRNRASWTGRWWLNVIPGSAVGLGLFVYLMEAFELQPTTSSIAISISGVAFTILARLASTRMTSGFLLTNNLFLVATFLSFLFPTLYLGYLSVYHDPINLGLIVLSTGLVGLAPVYALIFESMFPSGRRAGGSGDGKAAG